MELNDFKDAAVTGERLAPNQPLDANLRMLANQPANAIDVFGVEWAGWCAASALDRFAALTPRVWDGVGDELALSEVVSVLNDVLCDIGNWEDTALADAVRGAKRELTLLIECIRLRSDPEHVAGSKPVDGQSFADVCIPWPKEPASVKSSGYDAGDYYSREQVQEMFSQVLQGLRHA